MKLRKRYTIEYIDNERDMELFEKSSNPWTLFKTKIFEETKAKDVYTGENGIDGEAWKTFMLWSLCPDQIYISNANNVTHPLFCQMWMELLDEEGNVVYEDFCELPSTIKHTLYSAVNDQINKERNTARATASALEDELNVYRSFIKKCHAEKALDDYRRESYERRV